MGPKTDSFSPTDFSWSRCLSCSSSSTWSTGSASAATSSSTKRRTRTTPSRFSDRAASQKRLRKKRPFSSFLPSSRTRVLLTRFEPTNLSFQNSNHTFFDPNTMPAFKNGVHLRGKKKSFFSPKVPKVFFSRRRQSLASSLCTIRSDHRHLWFCCHTDTCFPARHAMHHP